LNDVAAPNENSRRAQALCKLLATNSKTGTNTVLVTHRPDIIDALGKEWFEVKDGEASIFAPENGKLLLLARAKWQPGRGLLRLGSVSRCFASSLNRPFQKVQRASSNRTASSSGRSVMSTMQVKPYSTAIVSRRRWPVGAVLGFVFRRITAVLARWRGRAAARRQLRVLRYMDDRLLSDIGLTRMDLSSRRETSFLCGEGFSRGINRSP
jgi:uncharacterized protein YjiS (DUF1127 family)